MDMDAKQTVIAKLDELKINYTLIEHDPVYTIEEMEKIDIENIDYIVKNLFLRDAKGRQHYLVVADKDQKIDLKTLQDKIGSTKLSFASEDRLQKYLRTRTNGLPQTVFRLFRCFPRSVLASDFFSRPDDSMAKLD